MNNMTVRQALKVQQADEAKLSATEAAKAKAEDADTKLEEQKAWVKSLLGHLRVFVFRIPLFGPPFEGR